MLSKVNVNTTIVMKKEKNLPVNEMRMFTKFSELVDTVRDTQMLACPTNKMIFEKTP